MLWNEYSLGVQVLDSHQRKKRERLLAVANIIANRRMVNTNQFIAELELNGLRKKVAKEYLDTLITLELVKADGEFLIWNEQNIPDRGTYNIIV